jgi:hypothetical protein
MNYTKPEVTVLGEAVSVIEHTTIKSPLGSVTDPQVGANKFLPAYDLDE